jgi:hypothetical protein
LYFTATPAMRPWHLRYDRESAVFLDIAMDAVIDEAGVAFIQILIAPNCREQGGEGRLARGVLHAARERLDTLSDCAFDFGKELDNYHGPYRSFTADHGDLDYYFIAGPRVDQVVPRFTWLTGRPAFTPKWGLGYSGSSMAYTDAPDAQAADGRVPRTLRRPRHFMRQLPPFIRLHLDRR